MRFHPDCYRLSFLLPAALLPAAVAHAYSRMHRPSPSGCWLDAQIPLVDVFGPSREAVFDHAATFLRTLRRRRRSPCAIAAILTTPARPSGRDSWSIILDADIAFSPTSIDPHFPPEARPPPGPVPATDGDGRTSIVSAPEDRDHQDVARRPQAQTRTPPA